MKIAAVAAISYFDNEIKQKIIEVKDNATWKDAFSAALKVGLLGDYHERDEAQEDWILGLPDELEEARAELGDGEMDLCVTFNT